MPNLIYVILGAAIGASGRYLVGGWVSRLVGTPFPWGTLAVNLAGCFAIGLAWGVAERTLWAPALRVFLFVGVLGAFTTFSSFGLETLHLVRDGELRLALGYVLGSNLAGFALVWLGMALARA